MYESLAPLAKQLDDLRMILLDLEVGKPWPSPTRMLRLVQDSINDLNDIEADIWNMPAGAPPSTSLNIGMSGS